MKNNGKKLLAGLGIGLTLAGGSMMMTGCTGVTEADSAKLWETVDEIKDSIANLEEEALKQKALDSYRLFVTKLKTFDNDIFGNLKIKYDGDLDDPNAKVEVISYKMSSGKMFNYAEVTSNTKTDSTLYYEKEERQTLYSNFNNKDIIEDFFYDTHDALGPINDLFASDDSFYTMDNVLDYELLENDNYKLVVYYNEQLRTFEITQDGYLVSCTLNVFDGMPISMSINFEYGVVTEKECQDKLDIVDTLPYV